jgi:hypothetical protein
MMSHLDLQGCGSSCLLPAAGWLLIVIMGSWSAID